jgi:hypothetical protein
MRDEDPPLLLVQAVDRLREVFVGMRVEVGGGLVENQDARPLYRDRDSAVLR